jgi:hypothetical protein
VVQAKRVTLSGYLIVTVYKLAVLQRISYTAPKMHQEGNTPMEHPYKFHKIQITCWPTLEPFGFVPEIRINNRKLILIKTVKVTQRFQTRTDAETYALKLAKQWIDDSNPDPPTA